MSAPGIDPRDRTTILVHFYRAMVGRADVWRIRMDTTTNWAIGATAAIVSFALGNAATPHHVVFIAPLMTVSFLVLEARRLTFYHLWQQRVLHLEEGLIRPALTGTTPSEDAVDLARVLDPQLGRTVPSMPLAKAAARRLRRVYLYLFGVQLVAWALKLSIHPSPAASTSEWIERAQIGALPGDAVLGITTSLFLAGFALALAAGGVDRRK